MLDAYFAAACVGLLIALAIACVALNKAQWASSKKDGLVKYSGELVAQADAQIRALQAERSEILTDVLTLESLLKAARKNDNRDTKGRYAKA